ncbi:hypothetical protein [Lachnoclostridium sp. MSJ-17]|uniref:hypothetical protein n=1 Tax=Lachnoclostridium sp. MSJ-17 TaxID=2841516 RepID=UPI001C123376|nr:hypothetical protein [Lachnoclostridium sp. MSJ-17]MBU5461465.1 hypothetical protein [Lachnoclostridium sp. MSJ-17]
MRKIMKKVAALGAAAVLAATAVISVSAARVENENLIIRTSDDRMDMFSTKGGNLLFSFINRYGDTADATSRPYVSVNESMTIPTFTNDVVDTQNLTLTGTTMVYGIDVVRTIRIIGNNTNGALDTAEFSLTLTNNTDTTKNVGGKFFLDTMVEGNDHAPFRVAGVGAISTKTQFEGDNIPASFQAFDSLQSPKTIGTGTFATGAGKPDVVQFRNFGDSRYPLVPEIDTSEEIGDSAVNVIWLERELAPGETRVLTTYYGLGYIDVSEGSELKLGATKIDGSFTISEDGNSYNPVRLTSYVSNSGTVQLSDVEMSLVLPAGVTADNTVFNAGDLPVRGEKQNTWTLTAAPSPVERTVTVLINAKSKETGEVEPIIYSYTIPAINGAEPIVEPTTAEPTTAEPTTVEPTTVEATTVAPTTVQPTTAATKDEATKSEATKSQANGTVKTGEAFPAIAVLLTLVAGVGAVYFYRRKYSK